MSFNTYKHKAMYMYIHAKHTNKLLPSPLTLDGAELLTTYKYLGHWVSVSTNDYYTVDHKILAVEKFGG